MARPRRRGRKKQYDVKGWVSVPIRLPQEVWQAFRTECFRKELKHTELVRQLLETHLQRVGLLKVHVTRDAEGDAVKSYELPRS